MQFPPSLIAVCSSMLCVAGAAVAQSSGALDREFGLEAGLTATDLRADAQAYDALSMSDGGWVVFGTLRFSGEGRPCLRTALDGEACRLVQQGAPTQCHPLCDARRAP